MGEDRVFAMEWQGCLRLKLNVCKLLVQWHMTSFVATANSNQYAQYHMNEKGEFMGSSWCSISVQELVQFLGVLLKMSVDNRELGGYPAFY